MIGDKWKSEIREFKDEKTRRLIRQLTTTGNNVHLYFTENSFDANRNAIIFRSDRASGQDRAPHENSFYCNHYHANPDKTALVGDDVDDLVLIDIAWKEAKLQVLCNHKTSWHTQSAYCHPTWSWDGKQILYASDVGGHVNLHLVQL